MSHTDVAEAVRATIAAYTHALDEGRTDDVVATFWPEGVFELTGVDTYEGTDALRGAYDSFKPQVPQRHFISNTMLTDWSDTDASALSDVVMMIKGGTGWSPIFVAKYHDTLQQRDGQWKFLRRTIVEV